MTEDRGQIGYNLRKGNRRDALEAVAGINHIGNISEQRERREGETYRVASSLHRCFCVVVVHSGSRISMINQSNLCRGETQKRK